MGDGGKRARNGDTVHLKLGAAKILFDAGKTMFLLPDRAVGKVVEDLKTCGLWSVEFGKNSFQINRRYLEIQGGSQYSWTRKFDDTLDAAGSSDDDVQPLEIHLESGSDRSSTPS